MLPFFSYVVNTLKSKIYIFIFSALLLGGFPNFVMQEAHATVPTLAATTTTSTTTTITVNFSIAVYSSSGATDYAQCFRVGTQTPTGDALPTTQAGGGDSSVVLTVSNAFGTGETPTVTYTAANCPGATSVITDDTGASGDVLADGNITPADGVAPTLSSAEVTSTSTIDVTFSESINSGTVTPADFTVTNPSATISSTSVSGSVVTLTLSTALTQDDTPTVTVTSAASGIDDANTGTNTISSGSVTATNSISPGGGGGGCDGDCEEPTLGVLPNGQRIVEDGFTYNGHSVDVERFFTPYPLITAQVGKQNTAQFKIYENKGPDNIAHLSFAFGLGKGEIISQSKAMIEVDFARDRTQTVTITDPENALDNVSVTTDKVACNGGSTQCLEVTIKHMFREPLDFDIVGTDVWDYSRQSWQNYYNHGIEVVGPSLNPPDEFSGIDKGHIYHLTETSKTTAVDEFGDAWTFQYGIWNKDFIKQERIQDGEKMVFDRMHSDFTSYKENLSNEAFAQLMEFCPLCVEQYADFDGYQTQDVGSTINKLSDPEIRKIMTLEEEKAQNILKYIMDPKLSSTEKYKALAEFEKDDRPISEILEEERIMNMIQQAERFWLKQVVAPNQ